MNWLDTTLFNSLDSALQLLILLNNNKSLSDKEIKEYLLQSELVKKLTKDTNHKALFSIWRLVALSEIPQSNRLDYTQKLIKKIETMLGTEWGYSLSGDAKMFLPCYNSMIATAMCNLGQSDSPLVKKAVEWILEYQPFERNTLVQHPELSFEKYGGCFKKTPCYISVVKAVMCLATYRKYHSTSQLEEKLTQGLEYILSHKAFKRQSNDTPITKYICNLSFPESYHTNLVDLVRLLYKTDKLSDTRAQELIQYIEKQKQNNGFWKLNFRYKADGYTVFDMGRKPAYWLSYIMDSILSTI